MGQLIQPEMRSEETKPILSNFTVSKNSRLLNADVENGTSSLSESDKIMFNSSRNSSSLFDWWEEFIVRSMNDGMKHQKNVDKANNVPMSPSPRKRRAIIGKKLNLF